VPPLYQQLVAVVFRQAALSLSLLLSLSLSLQYSPFWDSSFGAEIATRKPDLLLVKEKLKTMDSTPMPQMDWAELGPRLLQE
jgi:hypothetical protein